MRVMRVVRDRERERPGPEGGGRGAVGGTNGTEVKENHG